MIAGPDLGGGGGGGVSVTQYYSAELRLQTNNSLQKTITNHQPSQFHQVNILCVNITWPALVMSPCLLTGGETVVVVVVVGGRWKTPGGGRSRQKVL